jgi:hypothetical protein
VLGQEQAPTVVSRSHDSLWTSGAQRRRLVTPCTYRLEGMSLQGMARSWTRTQAAGGAQPQASTERARSALTVLPGPVGSCRRDGERFKVERDWCAAVLRTAVSFPFSLSRAKVLTSSRRSLRWRCSPGALARQWSPPAKARRTESVILKHSSRPWDCGNHAVLRHELLPGMESK